jgi:hypothetical protein
MFTCVRLGTAALQNRNDPNRRHAVFARADRAIRWQRMGKVVMPFGAGFPA